MESPRKVKRKQYRKATRNNLLEGTMMYHYSLKKGVPDRELMQILLDNPGPATACLREVVDVDNSDFFFHLCRFCMHHDKLSEVINAALTYQIHKTSTTCLPKVSAKHVLTWYSEWRDPLQRDELWIAAALDVS